MINSQSAHGLHSPFVFDIYTNAIRRKKQDYPSRPEKRRKELLAKNSTITLNGLGAGSLIDNSKKIQVKKHTANSLKGKHESELMYRILNYLQPKSILELGTSFGVSTLYLKEACPHAYITTVEGEKSIFNIATEGFKNTSINAINGDLDNDLPDILSNSAQLDCVIFDANHQLKPTLEYFNLCLNKASNNSFFIIDDIYWSKDMTQAWEKIKNHPKVSASIDLFHFGMVFFRKEQRKEHFTLRQFQFIH